MATVIGCIINPINISRLHMSTETFSQRILNSLISHGIDQMWEYFDKNIYELGLMQGKNLISTTQVPQMIPGTPAKMECMDYKPLSILKNHPELAAEFINDEDSFQSFSLFHLTSLFKLLFVG